MSHLLSDKIEGLWAGEISYEQALLKQQSLYEISPRGLFFMGFQTLSHTITLGRFADPHQEILKTRRECFVLPTDRGGQATLHSPGQLVIFPVIDLSLLDIGPKQLVCELLRHFQLAIQPIMASAVEVHQDGLYTSRGKLAFVGLRIHRKRIYHGLSINVSNDLKAFTMIRSCGKDQASHDKIARENRNIQAKQVFESLCSRVTDLTEALTQDTTSSFTPLRS